mgnify:CR=1 FL=1
MLDKLSTIKAQAEESKERLESIEISEESGGGLVRVTMNGNRKIKDVTINADLKMIDKEELEDLLVLAIDKTLKSVNDLNEKEVMNSASSLFLGM